MRDEHQTVPIDADRRRRLVRAAGRLLGSADAEDAVQDAFVPVLESASPEVDAGPAWLLTVVRHLAIDRLRRRRWLQRWSAAPDGEDSIQASPAAETKAALAEEAAHALRLLAAHLTVAEGAAVLLHEVFGFGHAEIAEAGGRSEGGSRQQLRRALLRLRQAGRAAPAGSRARREPGEEAVFRLYLQSLQLRDPQGLWAALRQSPVRASTGIFQCDVGRPSAPPTTACRVMQVGGQLGLLLTLDGVTLCVLPLGARTAQLHEIA